MIFGLQYLKEGLKIVIAQEKGTPLWKALLVERRLPWRVRTVGLMNYLFLSHINRVLLKIGFMASKRTKRHDISIIIAVRDRYDHRIKNTFESLRNQDYPKDLIQITLVDYTSKKDLVPKYKDICKRYGVSYIRVEDKQKWCRSHAINIGIRTSKTKYILTSDIDVMLDRNYISEAIKELKRDPTQVILCRPVYLEKIFKDAYSDYDLLKSTRQVGGRAPGINLTLAKFYMDLRGYDERFTLWGSEDDDLIRRFWMYGLRLKYIDSKTSSMHQWHQGYEGVRENSEYKETIKKNQDYFMKNHSIRRNDGGWGGLD